MKMLHVRNVHQALPEALKLMAEIGYHRKSRNGDVIVAPCPVATVYEKPEERVMFHPWRDANPFFHFYESLWMLAGRRDTAPLIRYVKRMVDFSDDGQFFNAAYGQRWRWAYGKDQLLHIIRGLQDNPECRRQVLQIWGAEMDLGRRTKDAACNLVATFQIVHGRLDMSVFCRSNDIIWGCYGANAVHFSMLQEYIASFVGVPVRTYTQISVNWHAYIEIFEKMLPHADARSEEPRAPLYSLVDGTSRERWNRDVERFITDDGTAPTHESFIDPFFCDVALPIVRAHDAYKDPLFNGSEKYERALYELRLCCDLNWRIACEDWIKRRYVKWHQAADDGVRYG